MTSRVLSLGSERIGLDTRPIQATGDSELDLGEDTTASLLRVALLLSASCWLAVQQAGLISAVREKALAAVLVAAPPTRAKVVAHRSGPCRSPPGGLEMRAEGLGSGLWGRLLVAAGCSLSAQPSVPGAESHHWLLGAGWPPYSSGGHQGVGM